MSAGLPNPDVSVPSPRLRELFELLASQSIVEKEQAIRDAQLSDAEREILATMLEVDTGVDPFFDEPVSEWIARLSENESADIEALLGQLIGPYRLRALLGQGGSAVVFEASRELGDTQQVVALKILRTGFFSGESRRRFRREQRILSRLSHPNIARLIDGGIGDSGVPYIAMEYIRGAGLLQYVETNALDQSTRLRLLRELCLAVDAAHRSLVVHRDLKPANVMVDENGHIKVLDFGVARLMGDTEASTATQHISLTPGYAAPEQYGSGLSVTTAVDIYALGIIAGELLTGAKLAPDAGFSPRGEIAGVRGLWNGLDADLKAIVRSAAAESPLERYASAQHLADDIGRYLREEPVLARPPSASYRCAKWAKRNRLAASLLIALAIAIASGLGVSIWQANVARVQAHRSILVQKFLTDILGTAETTLPSGQNPTPRQVVEAAVGRLIGDESLSPAIKADIALTLGDVSHSFGEYEEAEKCLLLAFNLKRADRTTPTSELLDLETALAEAKYRLSRLDEAAALLEADHALMLKDESKAAASALAMGADVEAARGNHSASDSWAREAVEKAERVFPANSRGGLMMHVWAGERDPGSRPADAIEKLEPTISKWRSSGLAEDADFAHAVGTLAIAKGSLGDLAGAEESYLASIAAYRRIYAGPHDRLAWQLEGYGNLLSNEGRFDEAESSLKEANFMQRKVLGEKSVPVAYSTNYLGVLELNRRNLPASERFASEVLRLCESIPIDGEPCPDARGTIAQVLMQQGKLSDAELQLDEAITSRQRDFGDSHPLVAALRALQAKLRLMQAHPDLALSIAEKILSLGRLPLKTEFSAQSTRADALHALGRDDDSLSQIDALELRARSLAPHLNLRLIPLLALKAEIFSARGKAALAKDVADAALALPVAREGVDPTIYARLAGLTQPANDTH